MKNDINKILLTWLKRTRTPPIKLWKLLADKNSRARVPPLKSWKRTWKEFIQIYNSNETAIHNSSKKHLNLPAVKTYFKVEWNKSQRTGRETVSVLEEKWWQFAGKIMPGMKILRHISLPESGMHLDIFWPEAMIALEIQGEQHWRSIGMFGGVKKFAERQERDARKRNICAMLGIKLMEASDCTSILGIEEKFKLILQKT